MIDELFLYDRDKGLFKEILKQSTVLGGKYFISPNYGHDLNTSNLEQYIKDPAYGMSDVTKKYPCCVCIAPKSNFTIINGARWERFYFPLFFLCKSFVTGTNQIKVPDRSTNSSTHHIWQDWKDMKEVAANFMEALKTIIKTRSTTAVGEIAAVPLKFFLNVDYENATVRRLSLFNNDQVTGVELTFLIMVSQGSCELTDYSSDGITAISIPPLSVHAIHKH